MSNNASPTPLLVLDVETTGLDPTRHQLLEVAVAMVDPITWRVHDFLAFCCRPPHYGLFGDPTALRFHAKNGLLEACTGPDALPLDVASTSLNTWLDKRFGPQALVAGKNVWKLDLPFLEYALDIPFTRWCHRSIDPGALLWTPGRIPPSSTECADLLGVALLPEDHRAETGVRNTIRLLEAYYARPRS